MLTTVSSKFLLSTAVSDIDGLCTGDTTVLLLICHWRFPSLKMCDCDAPPANISVLMLIIYLCRSLHNVCMMWECDLHSIGGVRTNQGGQWCQWAGWGPQTEGFYSKPLSCWIYFEHEYIFESFVETDWHIDRLVQERCNSSVLATEFRLFCTYPSIWSWKFSLKKRDFFNLRSILNTMVADFREYKNMFAFFIIVHYWDSNSIWNHGR